jgi:hypothetical protein
MADIDLEKRMDPEQQFLNRDPDAAIYGAVLPEGEDLGQEAVGGPTVTDFVKRFADGSVSAATFRSSRSNIPPYRR